MSGPQPPRDPFERATDGATGWEDARVIWRALSSLALEELPAAVNALDADTLLWAILVRCLLDRADTPAEEAER